MKKFLANTLVLLALAFLLPTLCSAVEPVKKDLGVKNPSFGATGQAIAMLALIKDNPHQRKYQISYKTEEDKVLFEYDVAQDSLRRVHRRIDGTGTNELLPGEAMYRLRSAAKGGSLFDTSAGQSTGTMRNF